ncbi:MAG: tripartite tricarboxylate transporter substrate binding protein [Betaproteobacteria bacterium]|nr:tripartite tricarboxylate transporter substrate binding protein [Betaproteobacteria bacterium]
MSSQTRSVMLAVAGVLLAAPVVAQNYPVKPVRIIVPAAPGGGVDIMARLIAMEFTQALGQNFIVENRSPQVAGADAAAKAPGDGYTLMVSTASYLVNKVLHKQLPYDPINDFVPVSLLGSTPVIICVHPSLPVTNVKSLVALAKAKPGTLNFGSGGIGSPLHLAGELFKQGTKTDIVHIAYKGTAPAAIDLLSGQVQMMFPSVISMYPYIQSGRTRVLAVMSTRRSPTLTEVPTIAEAGYPDLTAAIWFGLNASRNTPRPIADQLQRVVAKSVSSNEFRERLLRDDVEPIGSTPDQYGAFVSAELAKWSKVIINANIKAE